MNKAASARVPKRAQKLDFTGFCALSLLDGFSGLNGFDGRHWKALFGGFSVDIVGGVCGEPI